MLPDGTGMVPVTPFPSSQVGQRPWVPRLMEPAAVPRSQASQRYRPVAIAPRTLLSGRSAGQAFPGASAARPAAAAIDYEQLASRAYRACRGVHIIQLSSSGRPCHAVARLETRASRVIVRVTSGCAGRSGRLCPPAPHQAVVHHCGSH